MADVFADIPEGYTRNRIDPALREKLESVSQKVVELLVGNVTRLTQKTPYVEMTMMRSQDGTRLLVHFVNYKVTVDGDVTPAQHLKAQVTVPLGKKVKSVHYGGPLAQLKPLEFVTKRNASQQNIIFQPDVLNIYGLAVVELE
jgi:hypothetical protein